MSVTDHKNEDQIDILHNEETNDDLTSEHDLHGVITDERPTKCFIEPVLLFLFIGVTLYETVLPNAVEIQFCRTVLNVPTDQCLNSTSENLEKLQKFSSMFQMLRSVIEIPISSALSFFLGPWSDTYGRKPLMMSALIGYSVTYGLWTFGSSVQMHPIFYLLFSLPLAFSGGGTVLFMATFCYVCDSTTSEKRGTRLGLLQVSLLLGGIIGTQLCPFLVPYGFTVMFGVASAFVYLTLIYTYFFVEESLTPSQNESNFVSRNPLNIQHVRVLFESCFTKPTPKIRLTIAMLIGILACSIISEAGEAGMMFLFLQQILGWNLGDFANLKSYSIVISAIGGFGGVWLFSYKLKLDDLFVLSGAAFLRLLSALVMVFSHEVWHIYCARILASLSTFTGILIRTFISRVIAKDELGKVFSLLTSMESITPLFASLAYASLYNSTLSTYHHAIFQLSAFLALIKLGLLAFLFEMYSSELISMSPVEKKLVSADPHCVHSD